MALPCFTPIITVHTLTARPCGRWNERLDLILHERQSQNRAGSACRSREGELSQVATTTQVNVRNYPSDRIARGWYQIGWSADFPVGVPVPLRYFERALVAYRGMSGEMHVMDAFCRHLGAHLGYGGCVEGESIRCPYHGWLWDADGHNSDIPYSEQRKMDNLKLGVWQCREVDDVVIVYFDPDGGTPGVAPESFARCETEVWPPHPDATRLWTSLEMVPQMASDNVPDAEHFKYVHQAPEGARVVSYGIEGDLFKSDYKIRFGAGMESTWATPLGPIDGDIQTEAYGVGLSWNHLGGFDDVYSVLGTTPVTPHLTDVRITVWVSRTRGDGNPLSADIRDRWVRQQHGQVEADLRIWEHQTFVDRPPFAKSESEPMRAFRRWAKAFYETR